MKKLASFILALIFSFSLAVSGSSIQSPKGFEGSLFKSTLALYGHKVVEGVDKERFLCTAEIYQKISGGYDLLSAGHCIALSHADSFSVADDIGGPETPVTVIKYAFDEKFDFSIFELKTDKAYPVLSLGTVNDESIGEAIINPNFALGAAKQLSLGYISSSSVAPPYSSVPGEFLAQVYGAGGSSGSPIIDATSHKVIGILIDGYPDDNGGYVGAGIEPIDNFFDFLKSSPQPQVFLRFK